METLLGKSRDGYEFVKLLGMGAFAQVYLAKDRSTGARVAAKTIKRSNPGNDRLVQQEIAVMQRGKHPNVVGLVHSKVTAKRVYLFLEFCAGGDLRSYLDEHGALPLAVVRRFAAHIIAGVRFAHKNNVVHRDLKPANVLLSCASPDAVLKLADFGFARELEEHAMAATFCGTPLYMAPEVLRHQRYDSRADVWSVGVILYELLTGRLPFTGKSHYNLLYNIVNTRELEFPEPRDPACKAPVPAEWRQLIRALLQVDAQRRMTLDALCASPLIMDAMREHAPYELVGAAPARAPPAAAAQSSAADAAARLSPEPIIADLAFEGHKIVLEEAGETVSDGGQQPLVGAPAAVVATAVESGGAAASPAPAATAPVAADAPAVPSPAEPPTGAGIAACGDTTPTAICSAASPAAGTAGGTAGMQNSMQRSMEEFELVDSDTDPMDSTCAAWEEKTLEMALASAASAHALIVGALLVPPQFPAATLSLLQFAQEELGSSWRQLLHGCTPRAGSRKRRAAELVLWVRPRLATCTKQCEALASALSDAEQVPPVAEVAYALAVHLAKEAALSELAATPPLRPPMALYEAAVGLLHVVARQGRNLRGWHQQAIQRLQEAIAVRAQELGGALQPPLAAPAALNELAELAKSPLCL